MPASPSPSSILATIAFTLSSLEAMFALYLAAKSAGYPATLARLATSWVAYFVIGTASPAAMTLAPVFARSAGVFIPAGVLVGALTGNLFPAEGAARPHGRPLSLG